MTHISEDLSPDEKSFLADLHRDVERGKLVTHAGILKVARRLSGDEKYHNLFGKAVLYLQVAIIVSALGALMKKQPLWLLSFAPGITGMIYFIRAFWLTW